MSESCGESDEAPIVCVLARVERLENNKKTVAIDGSGCMSTSALYMRYSAQSKNQGSTYVNKCPLILTTAIYCRV